MAAQLETRGQLQDFLGILRRRKWQVLLPALFVLAFGAAFAVIVPKKYVVRTQVELRPVGVSVSVKDGANATFQIRARERVKKVVGELKNEQYLSLPPEERNDFLIDVVDDIKVRVDTVRDGMPSFVNIEYSSIDRPWAVTFLRALRDDWIDDVVQRDRNKLTDERQKLFEEKHKLERELLRQEAAVTELKLQHGLSATQPVPGSGRTRDEDPTFVRLVQNRARIDALELSVARMRVEMASTQKQLDELPEMLSSEQEVVTGVGNEEKLAALDAEILDIQTRMKGYRPMNKKFVQLARELEALYEQKEQLTHITTRSELLSTPRPNPAREPMQKKIDDLESAIDGAEAERAQLAKRVEQDERTIAVLQPVYEELNIKETLLANLRENLQATDKRYTEASQRRELIEGPLGNPFSITEDVVSPMRPTEPDPNLILVFSLMAGLAAGLALAVGLEYSKNCFRSVHDISRILVVPVLGSIDTIVTRREQSLQSARRIVVGVSSVLLIGSVVFVTWAWANNKDLLSNGMLEKIERVRSKFR
jgi:uncharacterized protein involved in exopolysaccharide biosynthesis